MPQLDLVAVDLISYSIADNLDLRLIIITIMAVSVGQKVLHPTKREWGVGEVLKVQDQKTLVQFEGVGRKLLKNVALIAIDSQVLQSKGLKDNWPIHSSKKSARVRNRSTSKSTQKVKTTPKNTSSTKDIAKVERNSIIGFESGDISTIEESETILKMLDRLRQDLGFTSEPNTALLLYTLLQIPGTLAHGYLGTLDSELRAHLVVEALQGAQGRHFGIPADHILFAARRIAKEICNDSHIDSRHLLLVCMVGSGWLARAPELLPLSTESKHIVGYSNLAVRAMRFAGIDPVEFLEQLRAPLRERDNIPTLFPSFFVFWQQQDRTRVLRIEEVGEFYHKPANNMVYPATLGLMDFSLGKPLNALLEFEDLLNDPRTPEASYQRFFEKHPEFLLTDEHLAVKPGVLLHATEGFGLKPDFFLQRRDSPLWDIAELKLPAEQLTQGREARRGLAAAVHWGVDQLRRYREYFLDAGLANKFRETQGLEVYYPKLTLIIGRDNAFGTYRERQRLTPPESRILTYDDLLRLAKHRSLVLPFSK